MKIGEILVTPESRFNKLRFNKLRFNKIHDIKNKNQLPQIFVPYRFTM